MGWTEMGLEISADGKPMRIETDDWLRGHVTEHFTAIWRKHDPPLAIEIYAPFQTDFATIPRAVWWFATPFGRHAPAAVVHDWLYHRAEWKREDADQCFYDLMGDLGVPDWKRKIMYKAVRMFGWICWKERHK